MIVQVRAAPRRPFGHQGSCVCDLRAAPGITNLKQKQTKNELPQESSKDTLRILPDPNDEIVEEAAAKMGLRKVGWIFTDLVASATTANKVELEHILKTIDCLLESQHLISG